jgi:hypothetical protein
MKGEELVRVIHRVNQKIVFTECESVRGSNINGYIELLHVKKSGIEGLFKKEENPKKIESICLPTLSVIAICYPEKRSKKNIIPIRGFEAE